MKDHRKAYLALAAGVVFAAAGAAQAQLVLMEDGNSLTRFDPDTQAGQYEWRVNGTNHMFQQWFWMRAAGDLSERSMDSLTKNFQQITDTNFGDDPRPDTLNIGYTEPGANPRYSVVSTFTLRGGPNGQTLSDIAETLNVRNISGAPLSFSFFQYADFDVGGTAGGDTGQILFGRIPQQWDGNIFTTEAVTTPAPSRWQVAAWPAIRNSLNDGGITNLTNGSGPVGPGDLAWALQWDVVLAPGEELLISKDKQIMPAPGSLSLIGLAGLAALRRRR